MDKVAQVKARWGPGPGHWAAAPSAPVLSEKSWKSRGENGQALTRVRSARVQCPARLLPETLGETPEGMLWA